MSDNRDPKPSRFSQFCKKHWQWPVFVVIILSVMFWQQKDSLDTEGSVIAPAFTLPTLDGELISSNTFTGKPTLYYFFAPWCSICDLSIENIQTLKTELEAEELNIVAIALDYQTKEEVVEFINNNPFPGTIVLGTQQQRTDYRVKGYPTYYIADSNGFIQWVSVGYSTSIGLKSRVKWTD